MTTNTPFWNSTDVEPKRNYRFLVSVGNNQSTATGDAWWAKTCDAPSFDVSEVEHNFYDNKYYYPGRVTWNEINMTVVDPKSINIAYALNKIISDSQYNIKGNSNAPLTSISKASANTGLGTITIFVYDSEGTVIEKWSLQNAFLKSVKFGTLDYSNDELRQLDMTIRYDWCKISTDDSDSDVLHAPV
jgi:hypothetical protein